MESCCSKKQICDKSNIKGFDIETSSICPNNGECKLEIIQNKGITIKPINESGVAYEIVNDSSKIIIKYNYSVNQDQTPFDGGYAEEILFEINANDYQETLIDNDLKKSKLFYRRFCACRGKTGLILVAKGKLDVAIIKRKINFDLNFDCGELPQIIKYIKVINGKL
jgi:hypothetical protein